VAPEGSIARISRNQARPTGALAGLAALVLFACTRSALGAAPVAIDRLEPGLLPVVAGDTDVGIKLGLFGQLARFDGSPGPYAWRTQMFGVVSVREGATGTEMPYREASLNLDWPRAWGRPVRLYGEVAYLETTNLGYYGVGNASDAEQLWAGLAEGSDAFVAARRFYQYGVRAPQLRIQAQWAAGGPWRPFGGVSLRWVRVTPYPGSLLDRDRADAAIGIHGAGEYLDPQLLAGVAFDSRDHETVTTSGMWHDASIRCTPVAPGTEAYCGANVTLRGYVPIAGEHLSIAMRLVGDALSANAPVFELSRYGGVAQGSGPAGSRGIRGAPQGRLSGRTKLIANFEIRSFFLSFAIGDQRFSLGGAAFADAGRVWTDPFGAVGARDGRGLGLFTGLGLGPRLRWGDSLVVRADFAYARLGRELGAFPGIYVDIDSVM
jgi:hypothetical protein